MLEFLAPVYLGWSLGANDASNIFGTAVTTRMVRFTTAAGLGALFVLLGAVLGGAPGMETIGGLTTQDLDSAVLSSFGAAIAVTLMTLLRLPVSASQAVVGAIVGPALLPAGAAEVSGLGKIVLCWVGTPLGALVVAMLFYRLLAAPVRRLGARIVSHDFALRAGLVVVGCYGAFALGANNVANVTGVYVGAGTLSPLSAAILGGASIALGMATYGRNVMGTVGRGIAHLNAYGAFVVVLAGAVTVHFYAIVGVPVSSSQAVVGAVLGVGLLHGAETVRPHAVLGILGGWVATPVVAALCSIGLALLVQKV